MARALVRVAAAIAVGVACVFGVERPGRVWACSCAAPSGVDLGQPLTRAEAAAHGPDAVVFTGRAVARRDGSALRWMVSSADSVRWTFAVDGVLHGAVVGAVAEVESARQGAGCGVAFEIGARYQVVATRAGGALRTHLCSRTLRLAGGPAEAALGGAEAAPEGRREGVAFGLLAVAALATGVMVWLAHRNKRDGT